MIDVADERRLARDVGLSPEAYRKLRSLVEERSRSAWVIGDALLACYGAPAAIGGKDGSRAMLARLGTVLGVSTSWLVSLRLTAFAWPRKERRSAVAWTVHSALRTRGNRFAMLHDFIEYCRQEHVTPSCDALDVWLGRVPRVTGDDPVERIARRCLALDHDSLRRLVDRLVALLDAEAIAAA